MKNDVINDSDISKIVDIKEEILKKWCSEKNYRNTIYWILKSFDKDKLIEMAYKANSLKKNASLNESILSSEYLHNILEFPKRTQQIWENAKNEYTSTLIYILKLLSKEEFENLKTIAIKNSKTSIKNKKKGEITDQTIVELLSIEERTLRNWGSKKGYKRTLYWILKSLTENNLSNLIVDAKKARNNIENNAINLKINTFGNSQKILLDELGIPKRTLTNWGNDYTNYTNILFYIFKLMDINTIRKLKQEATKNMNKWNKHKIEKQ